MEKNIIMYNKMRQTEITTTFIYLLKLLFSDKLGVNHAYHKKRVRGEQDVGWSVGGYSNI